MRCTCGYHARHFIHNAFGVGVVGNQLGCRWSGNGWTATKDGTGRVVCTGKNNSGACSTANGFTHRKLNPKVKGYRVSFTRQQKWGYDGSHLCAHFFAFLAKLAILRIAGFLDFAALASLLAGIFFPAATPSALCSLPLWDALM